MTGRGADDGHRSSDGHGSGADPIADDEPLPWRDPDPGPYTVEFEDGTARAWYLTEDGAESETVAYEPSIFVGGPDDALAALRARLADDPKVSDTGFEERYPDLHDAHDGEPARLLRVDLERVGEVRTLAHEIRGRYERERLDCAPGTLRLFDVDLDPGFRFCLDEGLDPTPDRELRTLRIGIDDLALANEDVSALRLDGEQVEGVEGDGGERVDGDEAAVLEALRDRLDRRDPDALVLSHGDLVPLLARAAERAGLVADADEFRLGRLPGWSKLAGESTYESYGQVGHSPARYRVPGRAIIDESNSFLWHQSGLAGLLYMVDRTGRPLQETARGSIGTLLTSRQIRRARREYDVLAPWNKWEPERFMDVGTLHAADRGGFTFAPEVGLHETVHEIDFASLYPRIIREYNVSPETVDCACPDADARDAVPELGYHICDRDGFLPDVLDDLLRDRARIKRLLSDEPSANERGTGSPADGRDGDQPADGQDGDPPADDRELERLRGESGAIKWVLVSCFGYQGYRNAKFGRIECHEAINAYARTILLAAKDRLEAGGWRVVHGIVDSLWVTAREDVDEPEPIADVIADVSREVDIPLEHDGTYEWVCFVPRRESAARSGAETTGSGSGSNAGAGSGSGVTGSGGGSTATTGASGGAAAGASGGATAGTSDDAVAGALTRYFGERESGRYKFRGIEVRQRSTPPFVAGCQREFVETLGEERDPAAVCDRLGRRLGELRQGVVDPADLVITKRVSKALAEYSQETHTVAALRRHEALGASRHPGQSVRYVVVDDDAGRSSERVWLAAECDAETTVDADYYARLLVRAAESVVSPLGWDRARIRRYLADGRTVRLSTFSD